MKFLFDLFPVILFFGVFKIAESDKSKALEWVTLYLSSFMADSTLQEKDAPIVLAAAVAILASLVQIGYLLLRRKKVDGMLWLSFAIIAVSGGATVYFHDGTFFMWKPTILYWCFGLALLGSQLFMKKNLIRAGLEKQLSLPETVWPRLNLAWVAFFAVMGVLNLYVAFNYPLDTWVNFKMFGGMGLMLVFIVGQVMFLSKYIKDEQ
ncbi:septation protein A [Herbaspirillum seropedicae]|uniref:septation protein A n=1 Tax=Herbaspirillum seropedicae TaxID=964 RepID=UPI002863DD17|nr:septation protein A [Herbaspirillum seropedicae]MDR6394378.1 intracellular septation protein [Herbaspirillum seropedicae]